MRRVKRHRREWSALVITVIGIVGCSGGDRQAGLDTGSAEAPQAVAAGEAQLPPRLEKRWNQMTRSDWEALLRRGTFHPSKGRETRNHRECQGDPQGGESPDCDLLISPADHVHRLSLASVDTNGFVIARITNVDNGRVEKMLRLPARDSTYWVVFREGSNTGPLRSVFVKPRDAGQAYVRRSFGACAGHKTSHPATRALFWRCAHGDPPGAAAAPADTVFFVEHDSPPWITCAEGCCNAEDAIGDG